MSIRNTFGWGRGETNDISAERCPHGCSQRRHGRDRTRHQHGCSGGRSAAHAGHYGWTTSCSSITADRAMIRSTWISRPALPGQEISPYCSLREAVSGQARRVRRVFRRLDQRDRPVHTHFARAGRQRAHQDRRSHGCRREPLVNVSNFPLRALAISSYVLVP